jgi:hypothetical protein
VADAVRELITARTERAWGDAPRPACRASAFMGLKGAPERRTFFAGRVAPATDAWSVAPIPGLGGALDSQGAQELAGRAEVPKGITGFVARNDAQTNLYDTRDFGYLQRKPTVSGRAVNESVEVVDFLNAKLNPTFADLRRPRRPVDAAARPRARLLGRRPRVRRRRPAGLSRRAAPRRRAGV